MQRASLSQSFRAAWAGLVHVLQFQRNARIEFAIAALVVMLAAWLGISRVEWALLTLVIAAVTGSEIANTALEAFVDLLAPEYHPKAKIAKDTSAAFVLVMSIAAAIIGFLILGPPLLARLTELLERTNASG